MTLADLIDHRYPREVHMQVDKYMVGSKVAAWNGSMLFISPAMDALMRAGEDIEKLAKAIRVVFISAPNFNDMPMFVSASKVNQNDFRPSV